MAVTAEELRRHYEILSDEALLEIDPDELVELARNCLNEEIGKRGLAHGEGSEHADDSGDVHQAADVGSGETGEDERICIVEYDYLDEAELALGLLEAAEIKATLESEPGVVRLMVAPASAEQALGLLTSPLTEDDLAAQAEAAGLEEDPEP